MQALQRGTTVVVSHLFRNPRKIRRRPSFFLFTSLHIFFVDKESARGPLIAQRCPSRATAAQMFFNSIYPFPVGGGGKLTSRFSRRSSCFRPHNETSLVVSHQSVRSEADCGVKVLHTVRQNASTRLRHNGIANPRSFGVCLSLLWLTQPIP